MNSKLLYSLIFVIFIFASNNIVAQPSWEWVKSTGGTQMDRGISLVTDSAGNSYVTGIFYSPSIPFGTFTLNNRSSDTTDTDVFLVKYDKNGNVIWAVDIGGKQTDFVNNIVLGPDGNLFLEGYFLSDSLKFDALSLLNPSHKVLSYILKFNTAGHAIWGKAFNYAIDQIALDRNGSIFARGNFNDSTSITIGTTTLSSLGTIDIFVAKYDSNGNALWAKDIGGDRDDYGKSIATDSAGNLVIAGIFNSDTIIIGIDTFYNFSDEFEKIFIAKFDTAGVVKWARSSTTTNFGVELNLAIDANNNIFVCGSFYTDELIVGTDTLHSNSDLPFQDPDFFVIKLNTDGNTLWANSGGGLNSESIRAITLDKSGNFYIAGMFNSDSMTIGSTTLHLTPFSNSPRSDFFIVKGDGAGNFNWAISAGGTMHDIINSICTDENSDLYVTGWYNSNTLLGQKPVGDFDVITAKLKTSLTTGLPEYNNTSIAIKVFPVPFSSEATLQSDKVLTNATITLYNSLGQVVKEINNINGQNVTIARDNIPNGIYLLQLTQGNQRLISTLKVIID